MIQTGPAQTLLVPKEMLKATSLPQFLYCTIPFTAQEVGEAAHNRSTWVPPANLLPDSTGSVGIMDGPTLDSNTATSIFMLKWQGQKQPTLG